MLYLISRSSELAVSLEVFKAHLDFTLDDADDELTRILSAAQDYCERLIGRSFTPTTWEERHWYLPYELQMAPTTAVNWIKYYDLNNVLQTWDDTNYLAIVGQYNLPGGIYPIANFPNVYQRPDAVQVQYTAGYSLDGSSSSANGISLPPSAAQAIISHATYFWEHPESEMPADLENGLERLLRPLDRRGYMR